MVQWLGPRAFTAWGQVRELRPYKPSGVAKRKKDIFEKLQAEKSPHKNMKGYGISGYCGKFNVVQRNTHSTK